MPYPTYTRQQLADFTGRPAASFPMAFVSNSAIPQAVLLFKIGTCLASLDDLNEEQKQLADFAILSMADAIHLSAPYQTALASPFNSETIGSYSYSKTAKAVQVGLETGVMWFDLAIDQLSTCDETNGMFSQGGIEVFEDDGSFTQGHISRNVRLTAPHDVELSKQFGYDPNRVQVWGNS